MMEFVRGVLQETAHVWMEASVYLLFGFVVAGFIHAFFTPEKIAKYLAHGKIRSVFNAALLGTPLPLCSCGVVPAALALKKSGANNGSVLSFLISTPVSGVDSIAVTYALMDPVMTVARPVSGFLTGAVAGVLENYFGGVNFAVHPELVEGRAALSGECCMTSRGSTSSPRTVLVQKLKVGFRYAFVDLIGDIAGWFLIGMLLAGIISWFVPHHMIEHYLGGGFSSMLIMLVVGVPLYICAAASTPIAAALILKGMSPGTALVFLLAGSATNIASLTVLGRVLGKRSITIYLGSIAICSTGFGLLLDWIYNAFHVTPQALSGAATHLLPGPLVWGASILLAVLMFFGLLKTTATSPIFRKNR